MVSSSSHHTRTLKLFLQDVPASFIKPAGAEDRSRNRLEGSPQVGHVRRTWRKLSVAVASFASSQLLRSLSCAIRCSCACPTAMKILAHKPAAVILGSQHSGISPWSRARWPAGGSCRSTSEASPPDGLPAWGCPPVISPGRKSALQPIMHSRTAATSRTLPSSVACPEGGPCSLCSS